MSLDSPSGSNKPDNDEKRRLDLGTSPMSRAARFGRRQFLAGSAALGGGAAAGHFTGKYGSEAIVGVNNADRESERKLIRDQLKEYEDARAKGTKDWAQKWWENFKKGYKEHGLNFPKAWGSFSEEALRARLARLDTLTELYKPIYWTFFAGAASVSLIVIHRTVSGYLGAKAERDRFRDIQDYSNETRAELEKLREASALQLELIQKLMGRGIAAAPSEEEFKTMMGKIAELEQQLYALAPQLEGHVTSPAEQAVESLEVDSLEEKDGSK